jgi:hypothetical protein
MGEGEGEGVGEGESEGEGESACLWAGASARARGRGREGEKPMRRTARLASLSCVLGCDGMEALQGGVGLTSDHDEAHRVDVRH